MALVDVVAKVLSERQPLRQTEVVKATLEAGYQTTMEAKGLRSAVGVALRKDKQFRQGGGLWAVALA
jgi:hypothetical protein